MVELLGMPPLHMIESSAKARKFFVRRGGDRPYWELRARPASSGAGSASSTPAPRGRVPGLIGRDAPRAEQQEGIARLIFRDLVGRMLCYDAAARITPLEALHHYFFCTDEIARFILDCNTLQRPSQVSVLAFFPSIWLLLLLLSFLSSSLLSHGLPPAQVPQVPAYPSSSARGHTRHASRQYTENALREAARLLDRRFPGIKTQAVPPLALGPAGDEPAPDEVDLERSLHNMSISPRE